MPPSVILSSTGEAILGGGCGGCTLFGNGLFLAGCQNSLDILERGPQQSHTGLVALLFYLVAAENGTNYDSSVAAHLSSPVGEAFTVPLDILLVVGRHMLLNGAVLVDSSMQPRVGADALPSVKHFYRGSGEPNIYLLLDVLKGNRIVHALQADVVIGSHRCHFPGCQFKGAERQRTQKRFLLCKTTSPAAFPFLEWFMVESLQTVPYRLIQLRQRQKLAVPQSRQNEGGDDAYGALHSRLVLGRTDSGRQDRRAIVLRQFLIRLVENDLILVMLLHSGFQVVALDDPGDAAEVLVGIHMSVGPGLLGHGEEGLHIAVAAVGRGRHEHIGRNNLARVRVDDSGGIARPVHLHDLTGLVIQVHGGVLLVFAR